MVCFESKSTAAARNAASWVISFECILSDKVQYTESIAPFDSLACIEAGQSEAENYSENPGKKYQIPAT